MAAEKTNNYTKCSHNAFVIANLKWALDVAELSFYISLIYLLFSLALHTFPSLLRFDNISFILESLDPT